MRSRPSCPPLPTTWRTPVRQVLKNPERSSRGHLTSLRRTKINDFSIEGVSTLEEIEHMGTAEFQSLLIPVHEAVPAHVL